MWIITITLAWLTIPSPISSPVHDAKVNSEDNSCYVRVEIKGTLETKGKPEEKWESILKGSSTGVRILAPGPLNAGRREYPPDDWPAKKKTGGPSLETGPLGVSWELFLGDDKKLKKLAAVLKGKSIIARGTLTIDVQSFGWRFPTAIRYIVRVSSLEEAKPIGDCSKPSPINDDRHSKLQKIEDDLKRGRHEPWEGNFYDGSPFIGLAHGWKISRTVGYVSITRRYDWGTVEAKDDRLILISEAPGKPWGLMPLEYVIVPWDSQTFLVALSELMAFCNAVNSGELSQHDPYGRFLLKVEDFGKKRAGFPLVPEKYKEYLLPKALMGGIINGNGEKGDVAVLGLTQLRSGFSWTIDVGKKDGVRTGMKFYHAPEAGEAESAWLHVISVTERQAELLELSFKEGGTSRMKVGMRVSTRDPQYK